MLRPTVHQLSLNNVRALRLQRYPSWRQADLAARVGCDEETIGRIERGDRCPTLALAFALAEALGRPVEEVFWGLRDSCLISLRQQEVPLREDPRPTSSGATVRRSSDGSADPCAGSTRLVDPGK